MKAVGNHIPSFISGSVFLFRVVNMKDGQTGDQVLHVVDQIQHLVVEGGVVECNEGRIEYLLPFHNNITSIRVKCLFFNIPQEQSNQAMPEV